MTPYNPNAVSTQWFHKWRTDIAVAKLPSDDQDQDFYCRAAIVAQAGYVINLALELAHGRA